MNVLIVDDEPLARERLSRLVGELEGYHVIEPGASNGEEALSMIDSQQPDVVLLDIRMPGLDGLQVAARLCASLGPGAPSNRHELLEWFAVERLDREPWTVRWLPA